MAPGRWSITEFAARHAVTPRQVRAWANEGVDGECIPRERAGRSYRYTWESEAWVLVHGLGRRDGDGKGSGADLTAERAALVRIQRQRAEVELERFRGDLVPIAELERELGRICDRLRAKILAMPGRYALEIVKIPTAADAQLAIERIADEFLEQLRRADDDAADPEPSAGASATGKRRRRKRSRRPRKGSDDA